MPLYDFVILSESAYILVIVIVPVLMPWIMLISISGGFRTDFLVGSDDEENRTFGESLIVTVFLLLVTLFVSPPAF